MDQITHWLSLSPDQKRRYMSARLQTVKLNDMSHPAFRRFKEFYEPLGLRRKERAQEYEKVQPATFRHQHEGRCLWYPEIYHIVCTMRSALSSTAECNPLLTATVTAAADCLGALLPLPVYLRLLERCRAVLGDAKPLAEALCHVQDLTEWTLLGEYAGVWDSQDTVSQRSIVDPLGLGNMRRDKVTELAYTGKEAPEDVQKGTPLHRWRMTDIGIVHLYEP